MAIEIKPGFISTVADNPTDFANGLLTPSRHNLPCTISGLTPGQLLVPDSATSLTSYAGLTFDGTTLALAAGTLTTAIGPQTWTETRNAAGVTFPGLKYTITDTASAAGSIALQILGGAAGTTNLFKVDKSGNVTNATGTTAFTTGNYQGAFNIGIAGVDRILFMQGGSNPGLRHASDGVTTWTNSTSDANATRDTGLSRVSAGVIGVGTGAAGSVAGTISAAAYVVGGAAGASGTFTSVTVVNGIVTAGT